MKRMLLALVVVAVMVPCAWAAYPEKPIVLIVPSPPGGGTDIAVRLLAELTEPFLKQKLVVENKPGAAGNICLLYTSPSPRDRTRSRMPSSA